MSDANRAATATASPPAATRGLRSERAWNDVRSAARIAREEGVVLRLHGTLVMPLRKLQKQAKGLGKEQKKPAEAAAPPLLSAKVGEAPPSPALSKRQQRSAQRLQEFQERKRATLVQGLVSKGTDPEVARGIVAREERKQLELVAAQRAAPMEQEAGSVEGRSPGSQAAGAQLGVGPKRARTEPSEAD